MLTASATIIENAIANKIFLKSKRSSWADPFFENIKTEIDAAIETHIGRDAAKQMRLATQVVYGIQNDAMLNLAEIKVQIEQDYSDNKIQKNEILTQLGFNSFYKKAQNKDQEALINLLFQFKTNLSATLQAEFVANGVAPVTITNILGYAETLKNANISQETFKGNRKEITDAAITDFNTIYSKVISIAKIASNFYKTNKVKQSLFSFSKVSKTINSMPSN